MPSDNALQIDARPQTLYPQRSASALGAAGGYRQPLNVSKSMDTLSSGPVRPAYKHSLNPVETGLEPLSEDDADTETESKRESAQLDSFLSPTFGSASDRGLTRPASAAQMRELKDHVKDLKGKISSLREQARVDSLKRRSLQSLRTPSPFTNAKIDQWYAESSSFQPSDSGNAASGRSPWNGELSSVDGEEAENRGMKEQDIIPEDDEESIISDYEVATNGLRPPTTNAHITLGPSIEADAIPVRQVAEDMEDVDDLHTEDGFDLVEDEGGEAAAEAVAEAVADGQELGVHDDAYDSESGESTYHDAFQTPVSHEDREDAFDYEHFFLHSAMGTISQQRLGRRGSFSSEGSVETTRGPIVEDQEIRPTHHGRRGSVDTTSTTESFETANEGHSSRVSLIEAPREEAEATTIPEPGQPATSKLGSYSNRGANDDELGEMAGMHRRHNSVVYRPLSNSTTASLHRPSISSFESTGTNRSFPLVNKPKLNGGMLTPQGSPDHELKQISETLMSETASICEQESINGDKTAAIQMLTKDDQLLVERLVGSLGKCVLGLGESGKASPENRMYRRRIDAAMRILEGIDASYASS